MAHFAAEPTRWIAYYGQESGLNSEAMLARLRTGHVLRPGPNRGCSDASTHHVLFFSYKPWCPIGRFSALAASNLSEDSHDRLLMADALPRPRPLFNIRALSDTHTNARFLNRLRGYLIALHRVGFGQPHKKKLQTRNSGKLTRPSLLCGYRCGHARENPSPHWLAPQGRPD